MHGMVVLLRQPKSAVTMRLVCVGYCADHKEDAIEAALDDIRGRGQIITVGSPDVVRPSRQMHWRRSTTERLAVAAQLLLSSADAVGEPQPYPVEPVSTPGSAAPPRRAWPRDQHDEVAQSAT